MLSKKGLLKLIVTWADRTFRKAFHINDGPQQVGPRKELEDEEIINSRLWSIKTETCSSILMANLLITAKTVDL